MGEVIRMVRLIFAAFFWMLFKNVSPFFVI